MFTELERKILDATEPQYNYITRNGDGRLYITVNRPSYDGKYLFLERGMESFNAFSSMFKDVKIGDGPIRFRKPILDDTEREYLKSVFKPFAKRVYYVKKTGTNNRYFIMAFISDDSSDYAELPKFDGKKMYNGMELEKHYSLEDLDIRYDD